MYDDVSSCLECCLGDCRVFMYRLKVCSCNSAKAQSIFVGTLLVCFDPFSLVHSKSYLDPYVSNRLLRSVCCSAMRGAPPPSPPFFHHRGENRFQACTTVRSIRFARSASAVSAHKTPKISARRSCSKPHDTSLEVGLWSRQLVHTMCSTSWPSISLCSSAINGNCLSHSSW